MSIVAALSMRRVLCFMAALQMGCLSVCLPTMVLMSGMSMAVMVPGQSLVYCCYCFCLNCCQIVFHFLCCILCFLVVNKDLVVAFSASHVKFLQRETVISQG